MVRTNSWFGVWIRFGVNLIAFLPLIVKNINIEERKALIIYFLMQVLGSVLFLLGLTYFQSIFNELIAKKCRWLRLIIIFALSIKLGLFPFYSWVLKVVRNSRLIRIFLIFTLQKFGPLCIIGALNFSREINILLINLFIFSRIVGAIGGFNQSQIQLLLGYSSINHTGWMGFRFGLRINLLIFYFFIYSLLILFFIHSLYTISIIKVRRLVYIPICFIYFILSMLRIGGIPPLLGFFVKWIVVTSMIKENLVFWIALLITASLVILRYYLLYIIPYFLNIIIKKNEFNFYKIKWLYLCLRLNFLTILVFLFFSSILSIFTFQV